MTPAGEPSLPSTRMRETLLSFISFCALERSSERLQLTTFLVITWCTRMESAGSPWATRRTAMSRSVMVPTALFDPSTTGRKPMSSSAISRAASWTVASRETVETSPFMISSQRMSSSSVGAGKMRTGAAVAHGRQPRWRSGCALPVREDDAGADGPADDHRLSQRFCGRIREVGSGRDHLAHLEPHLAARLSHRDDLAFCLHEVA